jgi:alanine-synthesizing transaminase
MARLNELCAARGLAIIADEVFLDYALLDPAFPDPALPDAVAPGPAPRSFATNEAALTFTMSGLSKIAGLPQMKASWLATSGPAEAKSEALARLEVIADTFLSMNAPVQHALPALLQLRQAFQQQLKTRIRSNLRELDRQINAQQISDRKGICTRLKLEGGWYAVLQLPAQQASDALALQLLNDHGVYVHPGHFYEFPGQRHVVASLITPRETFSAGIQALIELRPR